MGPTVINHLPAHPFFVHFVVVMVPVTTLMLLASVLWPAARRRLGVLTPAVAFCTLLVVPLTSHSGEWLADRGDHDPLVRAHAHLGDQMLPWSLAAFVLSAVWWAMHSEWVLSRVTARIPKAGTVAANKGVGIAMVVLAVAVSIGSLVAIYRIGDSGAKAVWHGRADAAAPFIDGPR